MAQSNEAGQERDSQVMMYAYKNTYLDIFPCIRATAYIKNEARYLNGGVI